MRCGWIGLADAIINEGAWVSKDGCESYYVKSIADWRL